MVIFHHNFKEHKFLLADILLNSKLNSIYFFFPTNGLSTCEKNFNFKIFKLI